MRRPKRPCGEPGCLALIEDGTRCDAHKRRHSTRHSDVYDSPGWKSYSQQYLRAHPACCDPFKRHPDRIVAATCTGHKVAHRGDMRLFKDPTNHYPLCNGCNAYQCVTLEGGFGNKRKVVENGPRIGGSGAPGEGGHSPYSF